MRNFIFLFLAFMGFADISIAAVPVAVLASAGAAVAAPRSANNQEQSILVHTKSCGKISGVMTCSADYKSIPGPGAYDVTGCNSKDGSLSISKFFKRNRRSNKYEIVQVIYNEHNNRFIIYYGVKGE